MIRACIRQTVRTLGAFGVSLLAVNAGADDKTTIKLCYENQEYRPYVVMLGLGDTPGENGGMLAEMVADAAVQSGLTPRFVRYPWKRCIALFKQGEVDGVFAAIWQKKRDKWGRFPKNEDGLPDAESRLWRVEYSIFTYPGSAIRWDGEVITGMTMGLSAPLGYVASEKLARGGWRSKHHYLPEEGLRLTALKRLDGYVVERAIGEQVLARQALKESVVTLDQPFLEADWYLPLSHQWVEKNPELAHQFWKNLARVREQKGKALYDKYLAE